MFLVSPSSIFFRFPAFLGGGFCYYSAISPRRYFITPCAPCEPEACVLPLRAVFLLRSWCRFIYFFLLFLSFFRFLLGHIVCCILSTSCGYYAVSVSVSDATRWAYVWCVSWYVGTLITPFYFSSEVYDLFQLLRLLSCVHLFSSWGHLNLTLQSYWSLSCDHGLHWQL